MTHIQHEPARARKALVGPFEIALLTAFGVFLYREVLSLPFYGDDPIDMRWIERSRLLDIWTSAAGVGYYRPLPFSVWWADRWFLGAFHPSLEHAANLVFHILNSMLVVALARRLLGRRTPAWVGLAAGALFVSFPFSYQAVPWVASLTHPLAAFLVLGSVLTALRARADGHWTLWVASLCFAVASYFAHESSLVVGILVAMSLLLGTSRRLRPRDLGWPAAFLLLATAYVPIYFSVPRQTSPIPPLTITRLTQTAAYLVQGLAYPVAPVLRRLVERGLWTDLTAAYVAAGVTVGLLVLLALRSHRGREMGLVLAWFIVVVIPAALVLPFDYLINGPRVLYLASAGVSIAWAMALSTVSSIGQGPLAKATRAVALVGLGVILLFSAGFVRERQVIHSMGGQLLWQVADRFGGSRSEGEHLVVNFPAWLAPGQIVYPVGHEGVEFMPGYTDVGELVWANSGIRAPVGAVQFSNALPPWPGYYYGVRGPEVGWEELAEHVRQVDEVHLVEIEPRGPRLRSAGRVLDPGSAAPRPLAVFDGRIRLEHAEVARDDEGALVMHLGWHADGPIDDADYRVFAHAYDSGGEVVAQSDGYPAKGLFPFWIWRQGERVEESRHLLADGADSAVAFAVGIYDASTGARLEALGWDGARFPGDAVPVSAARSR